MTTNVYNEAGVDKDINYGFGKYNVTEISNIMIPMKDGVHLAARLWIPDSPTAGSFSPQFSDLNENKFQLHLIKSEKGEVMKPDERFGTILEYLPYYKDGYTAPRDHARHPWYASHGFVCVRLDIRGSGASEGVYYGEYLPQEQKDCLEVLDYIAAQPWSNGNVGMYGYSWAGFNGLQMAYLNPGPLKTVVSLYSTDNRYTDDIHYEGGTVIGNGMLNWAAIKFCLDARPAPPRYFSSRQAWISSWKERLEKQGQSSLVSWLEHQHGDDRYWKHGSIDQDYNKVKIPVLAIGGLEDGYKNAAYRMAKHLNKESKVIIGPWTHEWPDVSVAKPNIDFTKLCLDWFNDHLKDQQDIANSHAMYDNNLSITKSWPRLQVFVRDSFKIEDICTNIDIGRYVKSYECSEDSLSLKLYCEDFRGSSKTKDCLFFSPNSQLTFEPTEQKSGIKVKMEEHVKQGHGSGNWLTFGNEVYAWAGDQTEAMFHSITFTSDPTTDPVVMLGDCTLFIALSSSTFDRTYIQSKVCDVFGDGTATLVTRCQANLCPLEYITLDSGVRVYALKMNFTSHQFKPGNRISISVSPTGFPLMWPSCSRDKVHFHPDLSYFTYQTVSPEYLSTHRVHHSPPKPLLQMPTRPLSKPSNSLEYVYKPEEDMHGVIYREDYGKEHLIKEQCTTQEITEEKYTTDCKVSYGTAEINKVMIMEFHDLEHRDSDAREVSVRIETAQVMEGGYDTYETDEKIRVFLEEELFWEKSWSNTIPRYDNLTV